MPDAKPSVQIAFAYSYLEPITEQAAKKSDDTDPKADTSSEPKITKTATRYRLIKRLAVTTAQRTYSGHILELLHTTDAETILSILTRKVSLISFESKSRDWHDNRSYAQHSTTAFTTHNCCCKIGSQWRCITTTIWAIEVRIQCALFTRTDCHARTEEVDVNFLRINHLTALPLWIYGLWKSPLLSAKTATSDPDWWTWMQTLVDDISPQQLRLLFYPDAWAVTWDDITHSTSQWTAVNPLLSSFETAPKGVLVYDSWHTAALIDWGDQDPELHAHAQGNIHLLIRALVLIQWFSWVHSQTRRALQTSASVTATDHVSVRCQCTTSHRQQQTSAESIDVRGQWPGH